MSFEILKDLYLFQSNFFKSLFEQVFLASNHMFSPSFNPCRFLFFLLNCFFMASFAISINIFAFSQLFYNPSRKSFNFDNFMFTVRFLFYRYLLKFSLNGVYSVATCILSLYWNSVTNSHSIQLCCGNHQTNVQQCHKW